MRNQARAHRIARGLFLLRGGSILFFKRCPGGPVLVSGGTKFVNKIGPVGLVLGGPYST